VSLKLSAYYANSSGEGHPENPYRYQDRFTSRTVRAVRKLIHKESSNPVHCRQLPGHRRMCRWRNFSEIIHKHNSRTRLGVHLDKEAQIHQGKQPRPEYRVKIYKCSINGLIKNTATIDRANRAIPGIEKQEPPSKNKKKQIFKASEETSRFKSSNRTPGKIPSIHIATLFFLISALALPLPTKPHPPPTRSQAPFHPVTLQSRSGRDMSYARRNRELRAQSRNDFARGASLRR
jgi:hypothetical protein